MIKICEAAFDPWSEVARYQKSASAMQGKYGATTVFVGSMRDFNEADDVVSMTLEHYPGMTEKYLAGIVTEAKRQWPLLETLVMHRVGEVLPDDTIVLVAVWACHRGDAFDAGRFIMEALKSRAPFWKKERLANGEQRWLDKNTDGYLKSR